MNGFKQVIQFDSNSAFLFFACRKEIYMSFWKLLMHITTTLCLVVMSVKVLLIKKVLKIRIKSSQCYLKSECSDVLRIPFSERLSKLLYDLNHAFPFCKLILHFSVILCFIVMSVKLNSIAKTKYS